MGFFSWITKESRDAEPRSICNKFTKFKTFNVWMHCPNGKTYLEKNYEGYGVFGGMDYYIALSRCNPDTKSEQLDEDAHRQRGIDITFLEKNLGLQNIKYPVFTEESVYDGDFDTPCESCPNQGYFYNDEDDAVRLLTPKTSIVIGGEDENEDDDWNKVEEKISNARKRLREDPEQKTQTHPTMGDLVHRFQVATFLTLNTLSAWRLDLCVDNTKYKCSIDTFLEMYGSIHGELDIARYHQKLQEFEAFQKSLV